MPIGFFPAPYPDELLYSLCARYNDITQYPNKNAVNVELFGPTSTNVIIDLPCRLNYFTKILPANNYYTVERIIYRHTLLNFYSPFLSPERFARIYTNMKDTGGSAVHKILGLQGFSIQTPKRLRFCPSCVSSDRQRFGETYWHRMHQLPGVEVCPQHLVFLETSGIASRHRSWGSFTSAEHEVKLTQATPLQSHDQCHTTLLSIARDAMWLLSESHLVFGLERIREFCATILSEKKFTYRDGRIKIKELSKAIKDTYSGNLLRILQCEFDALKKTDWVERVVNNLTMRRTSHPIRYLLLFNFLGYSAESFFERCKESELRSSSIRNVPFGTGPYPCLNPVCKHYKRRVINDVKVTVDWKSNGLIIGTFTCTCGFSYARKRADRTPKDLYRRDYIKSYGEVWEAALKLMWSDDSLSVSCISKSLGVTFQTIKYHAIRLNLSFPRLGPNGILTHANPIYRDCVLNSPRLQVCGSRLRQVNRKKWLLVIEKYPNVTVRSLRQKESRLYRWLQNHDQEWLKSNYPLVPKRSYSKLRKDWVSRDIQAAQEIRNIASRIKSPRGFPRQVTKTAIERHLQRVSLLNHGLPNMPLTSKVLAEVVESYLAFTLRRIEWATNWFIREGLTPSFRKFVRCARLSRSHLINTC